MEQIQYLRYKVELKLGQRGAEMVEYAIVLTCIAAVGIYFYSINSMTAGGTGAQKLPVVLGNLWSTISGTVKDIK